MKNYKNKIISHFINHYFRTYFNEQLNSNKKQTRLSLSDSTFEIASFLLDVSDSTFEIANFLLVVSAEKIYAVN